MIAIKDLNKERGEIMFNKIIKFNKTIITIFVICILVIIVATKVSNYYRGKSTEELLDKAENYENLIANREDTKGKLAYVKIADKPYLVATETIRGVTYEYYVVYDENNYMYIVKLKKSTYNKICEEYERNPDNFSYIIMGNLFSIDDELENIIIDEFNEGSEDTKISRFNYSRYFGSTYLDETDFTKYELIVCWSEIFKATAQIIAIIYLVIIIKGIINTNKSFKFVDKKELNYELTHADISKYSKANIILLDNYFISTYVGMIINKYSDIAWVYISYNPKTRLGIGYHSVSNKSNMIVYLKNGTKYTTATVKIKETDIYVEIIEELSKKNPDIMIGYSYENLSNYKIIKKESKNKK